MVFDLLIRTVIGTQRGLSLVMRRHRRVPSVCLSIIVNYRDVVDVVLMRTLRVDDIEYRRRVILDV